MTHIEKDLLAAQATITALSRSKNAKKEDEMEDTRVDGLPSVEHGDLPRPATSPLGGWRKIETAPKDGTGILAWDTIEHMIMFWHNGAWRDDDLDDTPIQPTHWMPLPAPPVGYDLLTDWAGGSDIAHELFAIGQLLEAVGQDRDFAQRCLLQVIQVAQKHFGDDAFRVDSVQFSAFLDEQLTEVSRRLAQVRTALEKLIAEWLEYAREQRDKGPSRDEVAGEFYCQQRAMVATECAHELTEALALCAPQKTE